MTTTYPDYLIAARKAYDAAVERKSMAATKREGALGSTEKAVAGLDWDLADDEVTLTYRAYTAAKKRYLAEKEATP